SPIWREHRICAYFRSRNCTYRRLVEAAKIQRAGRSEGGPDEDDRAPIGRERGGTILRVNPRNLESEWKRLFAVAGPPRGEGRDRQRGGCESQYHDRPWIMEPRRLRSCDRPLGFHRARRRGRPECLKSKGQIAGRLKPQAGRLFETPGHDTRERRRHGPKG